MTTTHKLEEETRSLLVRCQGFNNYSNDELKQILTDVENLYPSKEGLQSFLIQALGNVQCVDKDIRSILLLLYLDKYNECAFLFSHTVLWHHLGQFMFPVYTAILETKPQIPLDFLSEFVHVMQNRIYYGRREISPVITRVWEAQQKQDPCNDTEWKSTWNMFKQCVIESLDSKESKKKVKAYNFEDVLMLHNLGFGFSNIELTSYMNFVNSTSAPGHIHHLLTLFGLQTPEFEHKHT